MKNKKNTFVDVSIVIPVYKCNECLIQLCSGISFELEKISLKYEIILVDDCSPDDSWNTIEGIAKEGKSIYGIRLSRNFGQHIAIVAGLERSIGNRVVVMDCDLQDDPREIKNLYVKAKEGFHIVYAQRVNRRDPMFKVIMSKVFYKILGYLTDTRLDASVSNFGIYHRKVIDAVLSMKEGHKIFSIMVRWVGFSSSSIHVLHASRKYGKSSYSFRNLIKMSIGIVTSFSDKPLRLMIKIGFMVAFISGVYALFLIYNGVINQVDVYGWSSVMVSMWFIGGVLMSIIGVVGLYVGRTFDEVKSRPVFILDKNTEKF
ncbi:glycosyltransferase family 2 protein [Candidatus Woesearchaeota archaeon]|nr:glycosyltransferase family 2 protein [Candidatus Woesearchaeota archaeon]